MSDLGVFADLVPSGSGVGSPPPADPFQDLIPKRPSASVGAPSGSFADLTPQAPTSVRAGPYGASGSWNPEPAPFASVGRGLKQSRQALEASAAAFAGRDPDAAARAIAEHQRDMGPLPAGYEAFQRSPSFRTFAAAPAEIIGSMLGEGAGSFLPALGTSVAGSLAGPVGSVAGLGAGSLALRGGSTILEAFAEQGVDLTDEKQVAKAFRDPQLMASAKATALEKGMPGAAFDMASMGVAGRIFGPVERAVSRGAGPAAGMVGGLAAETGVQGTLGAGGYASGQVVAGDEVSPVQTAMAAGGQALLSPVEYGIRGGASAVRNRARGTPENDAYVALRGRERIEPTFNPETGPQNVGQGGDPFSDLIPAPRPSPTGTATQTAPDAVTLPPIDVEAPARSTPAETNNGTVVSSQTGSYDVVTPRGRRVPVVDRIVEADQLVPSHTADLTPNPNYPAELQPRDRGRAASKEQVARIANNLTPELLGPQVSSAEGSPIVGPDGLVESGNARMLAIQQAYRDNLPGAAAYRNWLQSQGYDVSGFRNPVLIRERVGEMSPTDRQAFAREANERSTLGMGATEQAQADARSMPDHLLDFYEGGDLQGAGNREFVRRFLDSAVSPAERASLVDQHGALSQEGARRVENAVFARAYDAPDVLASLREDQDSNIRGIGNALVDVAPAWAKMRAGVQDGSVRPEVDATEDLNAAVRLVRQARQQGRPVRDLVNQRDAFSGEISPATRGFVELMYRDPDFRRPASRASISDALRFYAEEASRKSTMANLFGDEGWAGASEIVQAALKRRDGGLFANDDVLVPGVAAEMRRGGFEGERPAPVTRMVERGRAAVDEVLSTRQSKRDAMVNDHVGPITFDWGEPGNPARNFDGGWGLSKIIAKRNAEGLDGQSFVRDRLPDVIARGRLDRMYGPSNGRRADLVHGGDRVVLSLHRHGKRESWVLTGFEEARGPVGKEGVNPNGAYAQRPSGIRGDAGAEPRPQNVGSDLDAGNPFSDLVPREARSGGAGASYVGMVQDRADGVRQTKPIRRGDILARFVKGIGAPIYQGRVKGGRTLGYFRSRLETVRIKKANDIEVAAHEMAHLLDDRVAEIRQQWNPATNANKAVRDELRGISYDANKLYEGFAEFVRLWMTQPDEAASRAPIFSTWFDNFARTDERYGPALLRGRKDMTEWFEQDALTRARSKIGESPADQLRSKLGLPQGINRGLTSPWDELRQKVFDDLHGIARMERDLTGGIQSGGTYETARLTRGKAAMVEGALRYGHPVAKADGSVRYEGKGLEQILQPVSADLDDFLMYAVGRSAGELMAQGREHLFTRAEIAAMRGLETPEFRRAFAEYQRWNTGILDFAQAKGIIDPAFRAKWRRNAYLPFYRVGEAGGGKGFSRVGGDWNGIKALTGGTQNIGDVLGNMIGNANMLISAALTNEVRQGVERLGGLRGGGRFMEKIAPDSREVKIGIDEVRRRLLNALGVSRMDQLAPDVQAVLDDMIDGMAPVAEFTLHGQSPTGRELVAVLHAGKPTYYEVADPLLFRALTALNRPAQQWLVKMLAIPKRIGQASVTLSPDFIVANFARDTIMASIMSKDGFRPLIDSAKGLTSRLKADETYREYIANGGGFASLFIEDDKFRTHLSRFYGRKGIDYRTVMDAPMKLVSGIERIADAFEVSTRLGEYKRAKAKGLTPREAAYQAREVSTDFAMRGDSRTIGAMYDMVVFLKAAVVSLDRAYRGVTKDPNRVHIAAKMGLVAAASAGLAALNHGNPLYDQLEDWDRDANWHFFVPTVEALKAWSAGEELLALEDRYFHLRFPKLWEVGSLGSLAERSVERYLAGQPKEFVGDLGRILATTFNLGYMPQGIAPLYEQATNRLQFFDRPIVTQAMEDRLPFAQSSEYTSPTVRAIGEATRNLPPSLQVSPVRLEALLRGYLNSWAVMGLGLTDAALFDDAPDMRLDQYPVLRRFYQGTPGAHSRYVTELYDMIGAATETRRTARFMAKSYGPDDPRTVELRDSPENRLYTPMNKTSGELRNFSKMMAWTSSTTDLEKLHTRIEGEAKNNPKLLATARAAGWNDLGAMKRVLLDHLIDRRNDYAQRMVSRVKERHEAE